MGLFSKDIQTMQDLFLHQLQDIYYAENQILKALPKMIAKATDHTLKTGFETHLKETENHVARLERVFGLLGQTAKQVDCPTINGLVKEADEVSGEVANKQVLDAALIASAQAVEHYEITRYGTLVTWAKELGRAEIAGILHKTLEEEKATDKKLTTLAEGRLNATALRMGGSGNQMSSSPGQNAHPNTEYGRSVARFAPTYEERSPSLLDWAGEHMLLLSGIAAAGAWLMMTRSAEAPGPRRDYSDRSGWPAGSPFASQQRGHHAAFRQDAADFHSPAAAAPVTPVFTP